MKKIGVLTRDCAGVNACIRAIVRTASIYDIAVVGVNKGYEGLINADFSPLTRRSVSGIISLGGTILKTARARKFLTEEGQRQAVKSIKDNQIDGMIVVGGNGSLRGAHILDSKYSVPVVGVPATIDNDVNGISLTIGADTALNVAMEALDKIRDTATSMERIFVVEVMGRDCGYIALRVALAGGCEDVIIPEKDYDPKTMCDEIIQGNKRGKISWIVVVAEGKAKASDVAREISEVSGLETREVVLGHIQRGGSPTAYDRILAAEMGNYSVDMLKKGRRDICVGKKGDEFICIPLEEAIKPKDIKVDNYYKLIKILT